MSATSIERFKPPLPPSPADTVKHFSAAPVITVQ